MSKPKSFADLSASIDEIILHIPLTTLFSYIGEKYTVMGFDNSDSRCILAGTKVIDLANSRVLKSLAHIPKRKLTAAELKKVRRDNFKKLLKPDDQKGGDYDIQE